MSDELPILRWLCPFEAIVDGDPYGASEHAKAIAALDYAHSLLPHLNDVGLQAVSTYYTSISDPEGGPGFVNQEAQGFFRRSLRIVTPDNFTLHIDHQVETARGNEPIDPNPDDLGASYTALAQHIGIARNHLTQLMTPVDQAQSAARLDELNQYAYGIAKTIQLDLEPTDPENLYRAILPTPWNDLVCAHNFVDEGNLLTPEQIDAWTIPPVVYVYVGDQNPPAFPPTGPKLQLSFNAIEAEAKPGSDPNPIDLIRILRMIPKIGSAQ